MEKEMDDHDLKSNFYTLEKENELRVSIGLRPVRVFLRSGQAEMYGTELALDTEYAFQQNKTAIAIFTWHGCVVEVLGEPAVINVEANSPMIINVALHAFLEEHRILAEKEGSSGPITLVAGSSDKSILCRMLLNYAVRLGRKPLFVELDVSQSLISIPGTVGVLKVEKPADIVAGFSNDQSVSVYHYGRKDPRRNPHLYSLLIKKLGQTLHSGLCEEVGSSGVIINTCYRVKREGYEAITWAATAFKINVLVVLGDKELYLNLSRDMPPSVKILYMPKLEGIGERSDFATVRSAVQEYFFGPYNNVPNYSFQVKFDDIEVYKAKMKRVRDAETNVYRKHIEITAVQLDNDLIDRVLGVSSSDQFHDDIIYAHLTGFVCVTNVNLFNNRITLLSSQPGPLPSKILMMGDITWPLYDMEERMIRQKRAFNRPVECRRIHTRCVQKV